MIHTIQNADLTVSAAKQGAELRSVLRADGTEYLRQGDPKYRANRAINSFPYVARPVEGKYILAGKITVPEEQEDLLRLEPGLTCTNCWHTTVE